MPKCSILGPRYPEMHEIVLHCGGLYHEPLILERSAQQAPEDTEA